LKVLVNRGNHRIECHSCGAEIAKDERYVRTACLASTLYTTETGVAS
jgi:predicted RNA-binding Zn-ribbon protein involved in translation (DUF1610 family)